MREVSRRGKGERFAEFGSRKAKLVQNLRFEKIVFPKRAISPFERRIFGTFVSGQKYEEKQKSNETFPQEIFQ